MAAYLRSGRRLSLKRCHALGRALALVLSFVHARGLVHGSVRPSNLFLVSGIVKLADLGLAHAYRARVARDAYRAPEDRLDVAGDVFSFGATLYHLLTGFEPVVRRRGTPPAPPSQLVPGVAVSFDRLLLQCLAAAPQERPAEVRDLLHALDAMVTIA
jgi:serine/threonine protein kinase